MGDIFGSIIIGAIISLLGQYTRYFFFMMIGKKKSLKSLSDEYGSREMQYSYEQYYLNKIVGIPVFFLLVIIIVGIAFS